MMRIDPFSIARLPRIEFGSGKIALVPELAARYGRRALLVTGARSFRDSPNWARLTARLEDHNLAFEDVQIDGEPSPQLVDEAVAAFRSGRIDVVIGVGGGSVLDAAKAIAGLLPHGRSVMDHLEGVGRGVPYTGPATPFIAAPTTAGTGSEATKNAVLSVQGEAGFKKSFRHESLVPQYAVVDPDMLATCPPEQIAANGMDALTQLIESLVSLRANPFTDALATSGIESIHKGFMDCYAGGDTDSARRGREHMAYAALLSGIALAQVGLGSVHGLASPLGAFFPIPHGVVCGTLVATCTAMNIKALDEREPDHPALEKYTRLGAMLGDTDADDGQAAREALVDYLAERTEQLGLPRLGRYGVTTDDIDRIVANARGSSMQTNPVVLTDAEIAEIVKERI